MAVAVGGAGGWLLKTYMAKKAQANPGARSTPSVGFWHPLRHADAHTDTDAPLPDNLANLPYLAGHSGAVEAQSVTLLDPEATAPGINLVVSGHKPSAELRDLKGNVLHEWTIEFETVFPGPLGFEERPDNKRFWRRAHVLPNGDLLAIFEGIGMVKLDKDSNLIWGFKGRCHHDLYVGEDGEIYTLTRTKHTRPELAEAPTYITGELREDFITVLEADGTERRSVSLLECFRNSDYRSLFGLGLREGDVFHTNTLEIMDGRFADRHPLYRKGNALVSLAALDTVAVVDMEAQTVVWALTGMSTFQHEPTVLDNGNILLFDNTGGYRGGSRVLEIEPLTQRIVWAYRDGEETPLLSHILGSCQRLPNGNTLIVESTAGRAFEVTPDLEVVWNYFNPHRAGDNDELIASLFDVVRLDPSMFDESFAPGAASEGGVDLEGVDALLNGTGR